MSTNTRSNSKITYYTGLHDKHNKPYSTSATTLRISQQQKLPTLQHCIFLGHLEFITSPIQLYADLEDCVGFLYVKAHCHLFELDLNVT